MRGERGKIGRQEQRRGGWPLIGIRSVQMSRLNVPFATIRVEEDVSREEIGSIRVNDIVTFSAFLRFARFARSSIHLSPFHPSCHARHPP